jgi:pimeloyl-ACP methyl ester carboxylesterase
MNDPVLFLDRGKGRHDLVVVVHGYRGATKRMAAVCETIREARPDADIYAPALPLGKWRLGCQKAETIVADLIETIDGLVAERRQSGSHYKNITLVGHSFGAVLARKIAIIAYGEQSLNGGRPAPFEPEFQAFRQPRTWAMSIKRIVLLAGMNRGWSVSSAMDWITTARWSVMQLFGETVLRRKPTLFAIRKGAPFLVQTRLQWLALMSPDYGPRPDIVVVQLLGTGDDQVSPDDNVDYSVDLFGAQDRQSYFYIEVRNSNHGNVIDMTKCGTAETKIARAERRTQFLRALGASRAQLAAESIPRHQMADNLPPEPDLGVTDVVFVIHGIRDKGFWTQKIARNIKRHAAKGQKIESWTESYGYFAMVPFIFRTVRQRKVEWLMDYYAEARARYPRAAFHYVGHSNGTYLVTQALRDYPAARFEHVVFAGSVVRCDYDWLSLMKSNSDAPYDKPRVGKILNYVATRDWVVALFPKSLQPWRRFNLGSAGHDGFCQASAVGPVHEVKYIVGKHSAGLEEAHWDDIAHFIVSGKVPLQNYPPYSRDQSVFWRWVGHASVVIVPALVAVILGFGVLLLWSIFAKLPCSLLSFVRDLSWGVCTSDPTAHEAAWRSIGFFIYLWVVSLIATRF